MISFASVALSSLLLSRSPCERLLSKQKLPRTRALSTHIHANQRAREKIMAQENVTEKNYANSLAA